MCVQVWYVQIWCYNVIWSYMVKKNCNISSLLIHVKQIMKDKRVKWTKWLKKSRICYCRGVWRFTEDRDYLKKKLIIIKISEIYAWMHLKIRKFKISLEQIGWISISHQLKMSCLWKKEVPITGIIFVDMRHQKPYMSTSSDSEPTALQKNGTAGVPWHRPVKHTQSRGWDVVWVLCHTNATCRLIKLFTMVTMSHSPAPDPGHCHCQTASKRK